MSAIERQIVNPEVVVHLVKSHDEILVQRKELFMQIIIDYWNMQEDKRWI